jgi:glutamate-1-semialdehyde 2,1-aminomutase
VYQAGTLSGNPVAVAAGIATLHLAKELDPYPDLARRAATLAEGLQESFRGRGIPVTVNRAESLLSVFFSEGPVRNFVGAKAADHERYALFFHHMLERDVWLPPSGYELWTLGTEHGDREIESVLAAAAAFAEPT